ncbi:hypothetical protein N7494_000214 [Penicillium frequentans]|uniref:Uncharacterized protein n=1 Tax=Penicillium frequentans TaxID=3151616 RepID=A0AAD6D5D0_9EURO|nr:hypothetical protein N7494_000214 [Penicillium glabrum]
MNFENYEYFVELSDASEFREKCITDSDSVFVWFYESQEDLVAPEIELMAKQMIVDKRYKMHASHIPEISRGSENDFGRDDILPEFEHSDGPELPAFLFMKGCERVHLVQGRNESSVQDGFMLLMAYR